MHGIMVGFIYLHTAMKEQKEDMLEHNMDSIVL